jgi:hypothetical protein
MYTYLMLGHAYSLTETVDVTVNINGSTLYSGEIPASPMPEPDKDTVLTELYRWTTENPIQGDLIVTGSVAGGDLFFAMFAELVTNESDIDGDPDQVFLIELEYPDSQLNLHAVTNLKIDDVVQMVPINIDKPDTPDDIRGWHYRIPNGSNFEFNYFTGPFEENTVSPDSD